MYRPRYAVSSFRRDSTFRARSQRAAWKNARFRNDNIASCCARARTRAYRLSRGVSADNIGTSARTPPRTRRRTPCVYPDEDVHEEENLPSAPESCLFPRRVRKHRIVGYPRARTCVHANHRGRCISSVSYGPRWRCTIILLDKRRAAR